MTALKQFNPPANQKDLPQEQEAAFQTEWSNSINRWTEAAILGDPWSVLNDQNRAYYYNPLTTDIANGKSALVAWTAFPNRILVTYNSASQQDQWGYAEGIHTDGAYGPPPAINGAPYQPQGPRGWQDEYCEWIAAKDAAGNITRIDFTCENPEYYYTLWRISPQTVLKLYQDLVDPAVKLEDLYLLDSNNQPVIDRTTGLPAYNITNQWNNQPSAGAKTGAVHLISPPNTLGAEIYLAAAASLLRDNPPGTPVTNEAALIQCSQYGTPGRNSDPNIGATVNQVVRENKVQISLQDPVGLYIQMPDFSTYQLPVDDKLPPNAHPSDCWQILRGVEKIDGYRGNFILHARFALPQAWIDAGVSFKLSEIMINGNPIQYGAQLTQTFQIALRGLTVQPAGLPAEQPQPCQAQNPNPLPWPQQLQDLNLFNAGSVSSAVTRVMQGQTVPNIVLVASGSAQGAKITFPEGGVTAQITSYNEQQGVQIFTLSITVDPQAQPGDRSLLLTNPDGAHGPAAPGMLNVAPAGTLGQHAVHPAAAHAAVTPQAVSVNHARLHSQRAARSRR